MELKDNQAALIIEASEDGGASVNVVLGNVDGLAGAICQICHHCCKTYAG